MKKKLEPISNEILCFFQDNEVRFALSQRQKNSEVNENYRIDFQLSMENDVFHEKLMKLM
jgi:hypothetical protein